MADEPTGVARRRRRLSDAETERLMLRAALDMVGRAGLTVSLEHISFEEVIREAGVARSAVYRRWPYKDLFFSDLLKELAKGETPALAGDGPAALAAVRRVVGAHAEWRRDPGLRLALAGEALRGLAWQEFEGFHRSAEWRTYLALHATFLSLPDGGLRQEVCEALAASERALTARLAAFYREAAGLFGLRLRPGATYESVAAMAGATVRGLVLMTPADPGVLTRRIMASPFGAPEPAEWSEPALAVAAVILAFFEADG
ncbi:TetR/AcrR family transcriptional regulator [Nonomuraea sp. NPDC050547]|uniref:TetR/AcrR family transcriptional regulator n=1 Tax=unclassified Nonomuraea TaxID=2593643 RepID=UPI0037B36822